VCIRVFPSSPALMALLSLSEFEALIVHAQFAPSKRGFERKQCGKEQSELSELQSASSKPPYGLNRKI
jgi:hypothetical protein